jgi:putative sterol carrier protein
MVKELLEDLVEKFNERSRTDESFRKDLVGLRKTVQFELDDGQVYHFNLKDTLVDGVHEGAKEGAEIRVMTDEATFRALVNGEMSAMRAYATKKLKFKASLQDLMTLRKFM